MNLPDTVRLTEPVPVYPVFEIDHPTCTARVALHGAHVMSWKPADEEEVLYLSPDAVFKEGKAIRGGIPVCWPWFNAHPADPQQPSHGLVRRRFWELLDATEDASGVTLRFGMRVGIWNAEVRVANLDGCGYLDTVGEPEMRKQKGDVTFDRKVERIYESSSRTLLVDDLSGRTILIEKSGSPSTVVWNPWVEKASALGDMPD